jgi:hypothetical protein
VIHYLVFKSLAGTPPIILPAAKERFTTAPAAITQSSPISAPSRMVTLLPIQQLFPILMPFLVTPCSRMAVSKSVKIWFSGWQLKYWPTMQSLPMVNPPAPPK